MRTISVFALLVAALVVSAAAAVLIGAVAIAPGDVVAALLGADGTSGTIIRELRLPRVLGAALVGGALAAAGTLLQGLLRNPLADPFVTGTSAGASLGAVLAVAIGFDPPLVPLAAFAGAMAAIALVWRLARLGGRTTVLTVLLAGVVLTSFTGALVTFVLLSSDRLALRLRAVLGWLQGGVSVISWNELVVAAIVIAVGVVGAVLLAPRIDAYAFGEETAAALGIDLDRTTAAVLATTALLTGAAVALAGLVGFVGLVIPHALRFLLGATHRRLVIASVPAGAMALVLADLGARSALAPAELPVGVITGLIGAPFFLALLVRSRRVIV
ncbi:MAG TPA: iron ABC transporter permease [Candidatus Limnocylindria bacterium]|jgi:iron complex transport system permease protein|nr:iron ABC transporter permease [Candidatus Limnocylindria bacterium]